MGQTTNQIEAHIEETRGNLGSNLNALERKVKSVTDWKEHFQSNPMMVLGIAFGGGILLANMLGTSKRSRGFQHLPGQSPSLEPHAGSDHQKYKALETWDNIKGALICVAATRFKHVVGELVPDFNEQLQRTEEKAKAIQGPRP